eukprot:535062_1
MARVKQTSRKPCTGGKSPRKQLATIANQKRKTPDNDELKGNETKRMKFNNNTVSTDDSTSDESVMELDIAKIPTNSNTLCTPMQNVLDNIDTIINSTECDESQMKLFVKKLCNVSNAQDTKFKEMKYRTTALPRFLSGLQSRYIHASDKIKKTAKAMLM